MKKSFLYFGVITLMLGLLSGCSLDLGFFKVGPGQNQNQNNWGNQGNGGNQGGNNQGGQNQGGGGFQLPGSNQGSGGYQGSGNNQANGGNQGNDGNQGNGGSQPGTIQGVPFGDFILTEHWFDQEGTNYYVRGKVVNNSTKTFETVYIRVYLKDEAQQITHELLSVNQDVAPQETFIFNAPVGDPTGVAYYEIIEIYGEEATSSAGEDGYFDPNLEIVEHSSIIENGIVYVVGQIENISNITYSGVTLRINLLDENGAIVDQLYDYLDTLLAPGEVWNFFTPVPDDTIAVRYEIIEISGE